MTTTQVPPFVSTRIDHLCGNGRCVNPSHLEAVAVVTRTDLLAAFQAVTDTTWRLNRARYTQFGIVTERAEYKDAAAADLAAHVAMLDAIYALDIPA